MADSREIASKPTWVTEGIFLWWIDDLLEAADIIVWLDAPWRVAAWRIVKRHVLASLRGANRHPGLLNLLSFLQWSRRYNVSHSIQRPSAPDDDGAITRFHTSRELAGYANKVVRCSCTSEVDEFVARIGDPS